MLYFVRHLLGFMLQLIPCMILYVVAFQNDDFWCAFMRRKGKIIGGLIGVMTGFAALMTVLYYCTNVNVPVVANIYMLLTVISFFIFTNRWLPGSLVKKAVCVCIILSYALFVYITVNYFLCMVPREWSADDYDIYPAVVTISFAVMTLVTYPIMYYFMKHIIAKYFNDVSDDVNVKGVLQTFIFSLIYTVFFSNVNPWIFGIDGIMTTAQFFLFFLSFAFCTVCLGLVYFLIFKEIEKVKEETRYRNLLEIQQLQYEKITSEMEYVRQTRHDMKHHYRMLDTLLQKNEIEEARRYIRENGKVFDGSVGVQFCLEPITNALMQYYVADAEKKGIDCSVTMDMEECPIATSDMTVLLGNCMENAIRANENITGNKYIVLKMAQVNNAVVLVMKNSSEPIRVKKRYMKMDDYLPASAFESTRVGGGTGLRSMSAIADRYGGIAEFRYYNHFFNTRISLFINS